MEHDGAIHQKSKTSMKGIKKDCVLSSSLYVNGSRQARC
jgi:hypothetical protein